MNYYVAGDYEADGLETWQEFHGRVTAAFDQIHAAPGRGRRVAVFTPGGPIGVAIQTALQAPEQQAVELHLRVYNASVTTFQFTEDRQHRQGNDPDYVQQFDREGLDSRCHGFRQSEDKAGYPDGNPLGIHSMHERQTKE